MTLNRHFANTLHYYSILSRVCVSVWMKEPSVFAVLYYLCFSRDPLKCYAAHALTRKPDERNKSRALSALHRRMPPLERFKKQTVRQAGPCACWEEKGACGFWLLAGHARSGVCKPNRRPAGRPGRSSPLYKELIHRVQTTHQMFISAISRQHDRTLKHQGSGGKWKGEYAVCVCEELLFWTKFVVCVFIFRRCWWVKMASICCLEVMEEFSLFGRFTISRNSSRTRDVMRAYAPWLCHMTKGKAQLVLFTLQIDLQCM